MSWLDLNTTLFFRHWCNTGEETTFRQILLCRFIESWNELYELKRLNTSAPDYTSKKNELKKKLKCFTPAACIEVREGGNTIIKERTGLFQLDFDNIPDVESLKKRVFQLPFIAYCSTSCSGRGFYALAAISEPEKLSLYGEHLFQVFKKQNIKVDTSKGRNESDLRFVHYDCNMLIRDEPEPLQLLEYSYRPSQITYKKGSQDAFKHALNTATKKYGFIAPGNRHNFIWLFCKVLHENGVTKEAAEQYVFKNFLPESEIKTNCINSVFK